MALLSLSSFDLTQEEKVQCTGDVISSLVRCASIVNRRQPLLPADCGDALSALHDALALAYDEDACASAPWSQSHLYLGRIMQALERDADAEDAYAEAASVRSNDFIEQAAAREAASSLVRIEQRKRSAKRRGGLWGGHVLEPPEYDVKSRGQRLRSLLEAREIWRQEEEPVIRSVAAARKKPCIVTPAPNALPNPAGKRAKAGRCLRRTTGQRVRCTA
ncbi:hypothetical protein DL764_009638 [Monosporascus ibericus]|uniref:Uncharacterized protein n=1 Tax=Monosporascus ibericus TaxID=155417 RepID=A0A4Q4SXJ6_9PEZI|nr:hypothetical protein DL764_009638 [Monosporascus ibericus]